MIQTVWLLVKQKKNSKKYFVDTAEEDRNLKKSRPSVAMKIEVSVFIFHSIIQPAINTTHTERNMKRKPLDG